MFITKRFLENVDKRSPMARQAMVKAGDKARIRTLKKFFISVGACEIRKGDAEKLGVPIIKHKYAFLGEHINIVLLGKSDFNKFPRITDPVKLEAAHIINGVIGLQDDRR